jgi:hypothetical protein
MHEHGFLASSYQEQESSHRRRRSHAAQLTQDVDQWVDVPVASLNPASAGRAGSARFRSPGKAGREPSYFLPCSIAMVPTMKGNFSARGMNGERLVSTSSTLSIPQLLIVWSRSSASPYTRFQRNRS